VRTCILAVCALGALGLAGCSDPSLTAPDGPVAPPTPAVDSVDEDGVDLTPASRPDGRDYRRMDVDQLRASIEQVTGGIVWTETRNGQTIDRLEELENTLGKPDYIQSTLEDTSPALLFQKFLGDAAANVCEELVTTEASKPRAERVFLVGVEANTRFEDDPEAVEANLRRQLLRFHGHDLPAGDAGLDRWVWLHRTTVESTGDAARAWRTVCIGLITHPDFYTY